MSAHRPLIFSATYTARLQEADEQARWQREQHAQPKVLLKRGFYSEGGRAGWGFYLEPAPPPQPGPSTSADGRVEETEGGEEERVASWEDTVARQHGNPRRRRQTRASRAPPDPASTPNGETSRPTARSMGKLIASHGHRLASAAAHRARMAIKTHTLVSLWFALTIPVIFWDAAFCFLRPRSMVGGDLHWIWKPYALYQEIDYVYGVKTYEDGDGFTNAQSALNIVENFMNIGYLYLAHVAGSPAASLLGFASAVMTLSKTALYWLQEYYCGGCAVGHNDLQTLIVYWIIPNGLWLVFPAYIIKVLAQDILSALRAPAQKTKKH